MRGLLVVNLHATTTSPRVTDVLVHALADEIDLEVVRTEYRGHAFDLGRRAREEGLDVVCTLGGDGTINETVNGMLEAGVGDDVPLLAPVPGGSANVFARSLGLPADPVEATGVLLEAVRAHRVRRIGLGTATVTDAAGHVMAPRWFLANVGIGIDAEIIAAMESDRAEGKEATPARYLMTTLRQFFLHTERRDPPLALEVPGMETIEGVFLAIVQNTAPWTYFGAIPVNPCPEASFDTGLDLFAVRRMGVATALRLARRMLAASHAGSTRRSLTTLHDVPTLTVRAHRPTSLQIDGEGMGEVTAAACASVAGALGVLC
ncbi:MAG: diacylglycerol/lipid kinase family protein [Candidatus Nanopelagicales bacterium]